MVKSTIRYLLLFILGGSIHLALCLGDGVYLPATAGRYLMPPSAHAETVGTEKPASGATSATAPEAHLHDRAAIPQTPSFLSGLAQSFQSNIIEENRYLLIVRGLKTTAIIAVLSTILGTFLGALVCFMRMSRNPLLNLPAKAYIFVQRGTPLLVSLMLMYYVVFASVDINPVIVSIIAFGLNFAAYVAEIYRAGINSIDKGQMEAGIAMGFTKFRTILYIILPQTIRRILPVYKGEFISLLKMTSVVGYIAVQDLTKASDIIRSRTFDAFFPLCMVAILYIFISWVVMLAIEHVEKLADPKTRRKQVQGA
ncbi:MAG: amino acid ABC transporter permease [Chlorobiaceae bacterium]|nr:amino acid ABC transporter permease [Chlorobiaceae bacterium]